MAVSRRENGQVAVFALMAIPAFMLLLAMVADAASVAVMRTEASAIAASIARYAAIDATQVACDPASPLCDGDTTNGEWERNAECSLPTGAVPAGSRYFDEQIVDDYTTTDPATDLAFKDGFAELAERLPASVVLEEIEATIAGSPPRVEITVTLLRGRADMLVTKIPVLGEAFGAGSRGAVAIGESSSTVYVTDPTGTRGPVSYRCA